MNTKQNQFSIHKYNYWKHLLQEEVINQALPDIVHLSLPIHLQPYQRHRFLTLFVQITRFVRITTRIPMYGSASTALPHDRSCKTRKFSADLGPGGVLCLMMLTPFFPISTSSAATSISGMTGHAVPVLLEVCLQDQRPALGRR